MSGNAPPRVGEMWTTQSVRLTCYLDDGILEYDHWDVNETVREIDIISRDITSISRTRILGYVGILEYDHWDVNETVREIDIISRDITSISQTRILGYVGILEYDHWDVNETVREIDMISRWSSRYHVNFTFLDGYCSTVQGLLDWFEVDVGFTELLFIHIEISRQFHRLEF